MTNNNARRPTSSRYELPSEKGVNGQGKSITGWKMENPTMKINQMLLT